MCTLGRYYTGAERCVHLNDYGLDRAAAMEIGSAGNAAERPEASLGAGHEDLR